MGFGAGLLDVMQGADYADKRFNAAQDRERQNKLNAMNDEVAKGSLEDYRRERIAQETLRNAAAGASTVADATAKQGIAALGLGRPDLAANAGATQAQDLANKVRQQNAQFELENGPVIDKLRKIQTQGDIERAGGAEMLKSDEQVQKMIVSGKQLTGNLIRLAMVDPKAASQIASQSKAIAPGKVITDFRPNAQGGVSLIDDTGAVYKDLSAEAVMDALNSTAPPVKYEKVKHDETLLQATNAGVKPVYTGPGLDTYKTLPEGSPGVFDVKNKEYIPVPAGFTQASPKREADMLARTDARVRQAKETLHTLNKINNTDSPTIKRQKEDSLAKQLPIVERLISQGMGPEQAAQMAMDQVRQQERADKIKSLTAPPDGKPTAPGLTDYSKIWTP